MPKEVDKPTCLQVEHLQYLDELRGSGVTNMFGAGPYIESEFGVSREESHKILGYWMATFAKRHAVGET